MKRIFAWTLAFLLAASVLGSCAADESPKTADNSLPFPKTEWGMTPGETAEAYGFSLEDAAIRTASGLFSPNESDFFAAFCVEPEKELEVLGKPAKVTFYFADLCTGAAVEDSLGLIYAEARYEDLSLEQRESIRQQVSALSEPGGEDPRIAGQSGLYIADLDSAQTVESFCTRRGLETSRILSDPLVTIFFYGETENGEITDDCLGWYGLNAVLGEYFLDHPDPAEQYLNE